MSVYRGQLPGFLKKLILARYTITPRVINTDENPAIIKMSRNPYSGFMSEILIKSFINEMYLKTRLKGAKLESK